MWYNLITFRTAGHSFILHICTEFPHPPAPFPSQNSSKAASCSDGQKIPSSYRIWEFLGCVLTRWARWWRSTRWRCWLRYCATSRKVMGSISDGVIGIFYWLNPLYDPGDRPSLWNISWEVRMTTSPPSCVYCLGIRETCTSRSAKGLFRPVMTCLYLYSLTLLQCNASLVYLQLLTFSFNDQLVLRAKSLYTPGRGGQYIRPHL